MLTTNPGSRNMSRTVDEILSTLRTKTSGVRLVIVMVVVVVVVVVIAAVELSGDVVIPLSPLPFLRLDATNTATTDSHPPMLSPVPPVVVVVVVVVMWAVSWRRFGKDAYLPCPPSPRPHFPPPPPPPPQYSMGRGKLRKGKMMRLLHCWRARRSFVGRQVAAFAFIICVLFIIASSAVTQTSKGIFFWVGEDHVHVPMFGGGELRARELGMIHCGQDDPLPILEPPQAFFTPILHTHMQIRKTPPPSWLYWDFAVPAVSVMYYSIAGHCVFRIKQ